MDDLIEIETETETGSSFELGLNDGQRTFKRTVEPGTRKLTIRPGDSG